MFRILATMAALALLTACATGNRLNLVTPAVAVAPRPRLRRVQLCRPSLRRTCLP